MMAFYDLKTSTRAVLIPQQDGGTLVS